MSYYQRHIFICENRRLDNTPCCANGADTIEINPLRFLRTRLKQACAHGKGRCRVNRAGCFDRCSVGPVLVIYPDNIWYHYHSQEDLIEICDSHVLKGNVIPRLLLANDILPTPKEYNIS